MCVLSILLQSLIHWRLLSEVCSRSCCSALAASVYGTVFAVIWNAILPYTILFLSAPKHTQTNKRDCHSNGETGSRIFSGEINHFKLCNLIGWEYPRARPLPACSLFPREASREASAVQWRCLASFGAERSRKSLTDARSSGRFNRQVDKDFTNTKSQGRAPTCWRCVMSWHMNNRALFVCAT